MKTDDTVSRIMKIADWGGGMAGRAALESAVRELAERAANANRDYERACQTIALMHEAATGRRGEAPIRGVVEDVAAVAEQAAADRVDAERYRSYRTSRPGIPPLYTQYYEPEALDAYVDAARQQENSHE